MTRNEAIDRMLEVLHTPGLKPEDLQVNSDLGGCIIQRVLGMGAFHSHLNICPVHQANDDYVAGRITLPELIARIEALRD